jgi:hypothetical protein
MMGILLGYSSSVISRAFDEDTWRTEHQKQLAKQIFHSMLY